MVYFLPGITLTITFLYKLEPTKAIPHYTNAVIFSAITKITADSLPVSDLKTLIISFVLINVRRHHVYAKLTLCVPSRLPELPVQRVQLLYFRRRSGAINRSFECPKTITISRD